MWLYWLTKHFAEMICQVLTETESYSLLFQRIRLDTSMALYTCKDTASMSLLPDTALSDTSREEKIYYT